MDPLSNKGGLRNKIMTAQIPVNLELFVTGITLAASIILGFMIFFRDNKSITNIFFLLFAVVNSCWVALNYLSYRIYDPVTNLWIIRLVMFFALCQVFSFFLLMNVFPKPVFTIPKWWKTFLLPLFCFVALLIFTPLVFNKVSYIGPDPQPNPMPGIIVFALTAISLVIGGIVTIIRKIRNSSSNEKSQLVCVVVGVGLMFIFIIFFNFLLPNLFGIGSFVKLSPLFTLLFLALTTYAIIKHQLLNVKIIGTEFFVFLLIVVTFLEIILSRGTEEVIFRTSIFISLLVFSVFLIQSIVREVKQREKLEQLTSSLENANKRLLELDKLKDEFVSVASHELRTPMTAIKSYLWMALNKVPKPLDPNLQKYLDIAYASTDRLLKLVQDMLTVSRIEGKRLEIRKETIDIYPLTKQIYEELKISADEKKINFILEDPHNSFLVNVDKDRIREVIQNLIGNALKFTPAQGKITISFAKKGGMIETSVSDTGRGIAPEDVGKLFHKFERIDSAYSQNQAITGTGLGLYIAKQIVTLHNGNIWVNSKVGEGTTFVFSLPMYGSQGNITYGQSGTNISQKENPRS